MASSSQIGMPQDSRNTPNNLIQAPESIGLSLNYKKLASNSWPNLSQKFSQAGDHATSIDQVNSQTEFGPSQSQNSAFLDGSDALPDFPPIPLPEIPDLIPKDIPEFIDGVRQWLRDPQRPECKNDYHELCCQKGAPDPIRGPPGRDLVELSTRRRKCSRCMHEIRSLLIVPLFPQTIAPHAALILMPFSGSKSRPECYFPEDVFCCFCMDGVRTIQIIRIAPSSNSKFFKRPALI